MSKTIIYEQNENSDIPLKEEFINQLMYVNNADDQDNPYDLDDLDDSILDDHTASDVALLNQAEINALLNGMMDDDE